MARTSKAADRFRERDLGPGLRVGRIGTKGNQRHYSYDNRSSGTDAKLFECFHGRILLSPSKLESHTDFDFPRRRRIEGPSEKRGSQHAAGRSGMSHIESVVQIREDVHLRSGSRVARSPIRSTGHGSAGKTERLRNIETHIKEMRAGHAELRNTRRPVVGYAVPVIIFACSDVI